MNRKVRWGVLSTAAIGVEKVIPAMQRGEWSEVVAISSRDLEKARAAAQKLGIAKAYGSYEELLADETIEAVYNPLPNQMHVPWTTRAAEAGKHVLCEKPLGLTANDARPLLAVRDRTGVKIQEAFMVRTHPRWLRVRGLIREGRIGELRSITRCSTFPRGSRVLPAARNWSPISGCTSLAPGAGSRLRFPSTRFRIDPLEFMWMRERISRGSRAKPLSFRPSINTRFRATCSRAPSARAPSNRFRSRMRSGTWPPWTRSSGQQPPGNGRALKPDSSDPTYAVVRPQRFLPSSLMRRCTNSRGLSFRAPLGVALAVG
jgi:Oxidoreductase family, NAD-binding Rossmann fold